MRADIVKDAAAVVQRPGNFNLLLLGDAQAAPRWFPGRSRHPAGSGFSPETRFISLRFTTPKRDFSLPRKMFSAAEMLGATLSS